MLTTLFPALTFRFVQEVDFVMPDRCRLENAEQLVEAACLQMGLTLTLKGSLSTWPGSIHWHYKKGKLKGTLELTLALANRRIWAKVQVGRTGNWIDEVLPVLRRRIEEGLLATLS